jgi:hypothetical protein
VGKPALALARAAGMITVVCIVFVAAFLWGLVTNPDLFSPAKFFLFSFLVFHLGLFALHASYELCLLILLVLLVGASAVLFEAVSPLPPSRPELLPMRRRVDPHYFLLCIWALSLPAIASEAYLMWKVGGVQAFVNVIGNRVVEFRGLGWAVTLSATLVTLNLAYFAVGLTRTRSRWWWCLYFLHFGMSAAVGLLSGSRGGFLNIFAMQLFGYHYIRGNVRLVRALPIAVVLVTTALILGAVRNAVRFENDVLTTSLGARNQALEYGTFQYGVQPLEILLDADDIKPAHGMTLVSLVTNVVPRDWWPDKPDTGGVFFTKEYVGNAWGGASNLTPTLLGEGVINFGWLGGIAFYVVVYPTMMYLLVRYYRRVIALARKARDAAAALDVAFYICVLWAAVGLMIAEVTTTIVGLITTKLLPLLLVKLVLRMRLWPAAGAALSTQPAASG